MALIILMKAAKERYVDRVQVFGESKLIVEWMKEDYTNQNLTLTNAVKRANDLKESSSNISIIFSGNTML